MFSTRIENGDTERIKLFAINMSGNGVVGDAASIDIFIRRDSDGRWWNGSAFQVGITSVTPTETDSTNLPGMYHYDFTSNTDDITVTIYATSSTAAVINDPWEGEILIGGLPANFATPDMSDLDAPISGISTTLSTIGTKVTTILKTLVNRLVKSGSTVTLYDDDESTAIRTWTVSDTERNPD